MHFGCFLIPDTFHRADSVLGQRFYDGYSLWWVKNTAFIHIIHMTTVPIPVGKDSKDISTMDDLIKDRMSQVISPCF